MEAAGDRRTDVRAASGWCCYSNRRGPQWLASPGTNIAVNADGSTEPAGYGTVHYNADEDYQRAVSMIVTAAVSTELASEDIYGALSNLSSAVPSGVSCATLLSVQE